MRITIADQGPGIPAEIADTLFEKFRRGPGVKAGGVGLGLSIVQGFMRAQGGDVAVDAPSEGGARFTLSLPFKRAQSLQGT